MPSKKRYTDEYLKKVLLDKAKELGRTPSRREVKHGTAISQRFGNGSYDDALRCVGLKPNYSRFNKRKPKETLKSRLERLSCIEIYEMVLNGEIDRFPRYFWQEISDLELRELLKYFFEEKLKWSIDDIKNNLDSYVFMKYKLGGGLFNSLFEGSPFKVIDFTYPNKIKEWELKCTPLSYWTLEKCVEVTKEILEKEKWTEEDIKNHPIYEIFNKYGVTTIYIRFFKGNSYKLINSIYPNKFKPWELPRVPKNYWNTDTGIEAVRWMIEDELNWNNEEIKKQLCYNTFEKYRLAGMLNIVFDCSPFKAINATYPGIFNEEDFNNVPINYWTKEKAIASIKNILDDLSDEDIKRCVTVKFFIENGLRYPFQIYFGNKPFAVLDTIYPNRFDKKDFFTRD
ncbi:homing endonuclease associated repeat-containing protein [Clostridium perfringens]